MALGIIGSTNAQAWPEAGVAGPPANTRASGRFTRVDDRVAGRVWGRGFE